MEAAAGAEILTEAGEAVCRERCHLGLEDVTLLAAAHGAESGGELVR